MQQVAAGVGAGVAEAVVLGRSTSSITASHGKHCADVEAGVGAAGGVGVVELAVRRVERVDAVVAVAVAP